MSKMIVCKGCGAEIFKGVKNCPQCGKRNKKPTGLIIIGVIILLIIISSISDSIKDAQAKKVEYIWPSTGIATLLTQPESVYGKIHSETETYFSIDIYGVSLGEFNEYVDNCKEEGFTVDYSGSSSSYYADDADGNSLSVYYNEDDEEMSISISAFIEETEANDVQDNGDVVDSEPAEGVETDVIEESDIVESEPEENTEIETAEENNADFRAWVDSYEEFMDEYVDFMKKYNESDGTDLSLLADYTSVMTKYSEFAAEANEINEEELSAEDYAYYLDASARIMKKISEI